jgi:hypothetical protein
MTSHSPYRITIGSEEPTASILRAEIASTLKITSKFFQQYHVPEEPQDRAWTHL